MASEQISYYQTLTRNGGLRACVRDSLASTSSAKLEVEISKREQRSAAGKAGGRGRPKVNSGAHTSDAPLSDKPKARTPRAEEKCAKAAKVSVHGHATTPYTLSWAGAVLEAHRGPERVPRFNVGGIRPYSKGA